MGGLSSQALAALVALLTVIVGADVVLVIAGHTTEATALPILLGAVAPTLLTSIRAHNVTAAVDKKLDELLNGGTEAAVRKVVRQELARLVAHDEKAGRSRVADAGANLPTAEARRRQADAERQARKSRP